MRRLLLVLACAMPAVAHAERATDRFAPDQIQMAEDSLRAARAAAEAADFKRAGMLAREARVDARITYGMTDDDRVRSEAASIAAQADTLERSIGAQGQ